MNIYVDYNTKKKLVYMKYRICIYFWNKFRVQVPSENMYIIPKEIPMLVGGQSFRGTIWDYNSVSKSDLAIDEMGHIFWDNFPLYVFGISIECSSCSSLGHFIGAIISSINYLDRYQVLFTPILENKVFDIDVARSFGRLLCLCR